MLRSDEKSVAESFRRMGGATRGSTRAPAPQPQPHSPAPAPAAGRAPQARRRGVPLCFIGSACIMIGFFATVAAMAEGRENLAGPLHLSDDRGRAHRPPREIPQVAQRPAFLARPCSARRTRSRAPSPCRRDSGRRSWRASPSRFRPSKVRPCRRASPHRSVRRRAHRPVRRASPRVPDRCLDHWKTSSSSPASIATDIARSFGIVIRKPSAVVPEGEDFGRGGLGNAPERHGFGCFGGFGLHGEGSVLEHEKGQDLVPFVGPHGIAARAALKDQVAVDRGLQALDVGAGTLDGLVVGAAKARGVALD